MAEINREDLAYAAGFFDGEGSVGIKMHKGKRGLFHTPYATVSQVRPEVLIWMRELFGGSIRFNEQGGKNGIWALQLSARKALNMLRALLPFLKVKKQEAQLVLEAFERKTINRVAGVPQDLQDLRQGNRLKIMALRKPSEWPRG